MKPDIAQEITFVCVMRQYAMNGVYHILEI